MFSETIQRIVDAMEVKFHYAHRYEVLKPYTITGTPQNKSILFQPQAGFFTGGKNHEVVLPGEYFLIPKGQQNYFQMAGNHCPKIDPAFMSDVNHPLRNEYIRQLSNDDTISPGRSYGASVGFELLIHGVVSIFQLMGLTTMKLGPLPDMNCAFQGIIKEANSSEIGSSALKKKYLEEIMIHIMRSLYKRDDLQMTIQRMDYLLDRRLIDVVEYIQANLEGDLSNNKIAQVACVTKDYVGQFFKSLTNRNLQDYIEERRLERAFNLIRSSDENIQQIASRVGFKDPAYFSRRFKIKFGVNAKDVRKPAQVESPLS